MQTPTTTTAQQTIDALAARYDALALEVSAAPASRDGSAWARDRHAELVRLARTLRRLEQG